MFLQWTLVAVTANLLAIIYKKNITNKHPNN